MRKKVLSAVLVLALLAGFTACDSDSSGNPLGPATTSSSTSSSTEASSEPTPEPTPEPIYQRYLTGLEITDDYPEEKRVTAVMIGNNEDARPHYGLSDASIVVEITVEYNITRLMAIYENYETMPRVGPMRSARDQFLQLILPMQAFFIHDGPSGEVPTNWMLRDYGYLIRDLGIANSYRSNDGGTRKKTEYTEFTDGERITKKVESGIENGTISLEAGYTSTVFNFVSYKEEPRVPAEGAATDFGVIFQPSYRTLFSYDSASGRYGMYQYDRSKGSVDKTIDPNHNNEQVYFDNVLVLFASMSKYANSPLPNVDYYGGGGFYFSQGGWERLIWNKGSPNFALQLSTLDGEPFYVNPGTTYIAIVEDIYSEDFYQGLLAGTSWTDASKGSSAPSSQLPED